MRMLRAPPVASFERQTQARQASALRDLVERWRSGDGVVVSGMWPLLAELLASSRAQAPLKEEVLRTVARHAASVGSDTELFVDVVGRAEARWQVRALASIARHRLASRALARLAQTRALDVGVRRAALAALAAVQESPPLLRLANRLRKEPELEAAATRVIEGFEARRSSAIEEIAALRTGDVLRDRGAAVRIDGVLDLGTIDFGATRLEVWDPVQVEPMFLRLTIPRRRARASAALSGERARALKLRFTTARVDRWRRIGAASSPFGTAVLSRAGLRHELDQMEFDSSFWDEVFDKAFDPADGAAVVELQLGGATVPLLAWNDAQLSATVYRGEDRRGRTVALLFDGVRVTAADEVD